MMDSNWKRTTFIPVGTKLSSTKKIKQCFISPLAIGIEGGDNGSLMISDIGN